jgi:hypothetical protein
VLRAEGWRVPRFWEHEDPARSAPPSAARRQEEVIGQASGSSCWSCARFQSGAAIHHQVSRAPTTAAVDQASVRSKTTSVTHQQHRARDRQRQHGQAEERRPVAALQQRLLVVLPEQHAVLRGRRDVQPGRHRGGEQRREVDVALEVGELGATLLERDHEQEREEELHPGQRHPQLVEQLHELAVDPLLAALPRGVPAALRIPHVGDPRRLPSSCRRSSAGWCHAAGRGTRGPYGRLPREDDVSMWTPMEPELGQGDDGIPAADPGAGAPPPADGFGVGGEEPDRPEEGGAQDVDDGDAGG